MKVKLFDENHEKIQKKKINEFLIELDESKIIDIKYQLNIMYDYKEQIYCYTAMVIYRD